MTQNIVFGCTFQGLSCSKFIFESMWVLHETNDVSIDINTYFKCFSMEFGGQHVCPPYRVQGKNDSVEI